MLGEKMRKEKFKVKSKYDYHNQLWCWLQSTDLNCEASTKGWASNVIGYLFYVTLSNGRISKVNSGQDLGPVPKKLN